MCFIKIFKENCYTVLNAIIAINRFFEYVLYVSLFPAKFNSICVVLVNSLFCLKKNYLLMIF